MLATAAVIDASAVSIPIEVVTQNRRVSLFSLERSFSCSIRFRSCSSRNFRSRSKVCSISRLPISVPQFETGIYIHLVIVLGGFLGPFQTLFDRFLLPICMAGVIV